MDQDFLNKRFENYELRPQDADRVQAVLNHVYAYHPALVYDVGCGSGLFSALIKGMTFPVEACDGYRNAAPTVVGIDNSDTALWDARKRDTMHGWIKQDLNKPLKCETAPADFVLCTEVIEHIFNCEELLRTCRKLTKPDGVFLLTTPNLASWINRLCLLFGLQPFFTETGSERCTGNPLRDEKNLVPGGHIRLFTRRAMQAQLENAGFEVVQYFGVSGFGRLTPIDMFIRHYFPGMASVMGFLCRPKAVAA